MLLKRLGFGMAAALAAVGVSASGFAANDWVPVASISPTATLVTNTLCYSDGTDMACDGAAGLMTTSGTLSLNGLGVNALAANNVSITQNVSVTGNVSAAKFIGDGSGLTGLAASATVLDGVSGSVIFRDNLGNLTASNSLVVSDSSMGLGNPADLSPGEGRTFTLYNNGPNTSAAAGNAALIIRSANRNAVLTLMSDSGGSGGVYFRKTSVSSYNGALLYLRSPEDYMNVIVSGSTVMALYSNRNVISGTTFINSWTTINGITSPSAPLDVYGTVKGQAFLTIPTSVQMPQWASDNLGANITLGGARNPAIAFLPADTYVATVSNVAVFNTASGFTIARAPALGDAATPMSVLMTISATSRNVGIGTLTPNAKLEVNGTISATNLLVNGVSVTGGVSTFASLTDVSYSAAGSGGNIFGPGSLAGAVAGVTDTTAFGALALSSLTSGYNNSAFGRAALQRTTTGFFNAAFGRYALTNNTSGNANVAMGNSALATNTTGFANTAVGYQALANNSTANYNTALGYMSLNAVSGSSNQFNVGLGTLAGQLLASGGSNTLIGHNAGGAMTSGDNNIVIGASLSPYSNTGSNQLNLGNVIFGDLGNGSTLRGKIGINVTSPTASLEVSGTISATALTVNGVAVTGGAGTFASLTDVSYSAAAFNVFGPGSLMGAVNGVSNTTAFGYGALNMGGNTGSYNSAIGSTALARNTSGAGNTALGNGALYYNTTGNSNVGIGLNAGFWVSGTAGSNVLVGNAAGQSTSGNGAFSFVTAVGSNAGLLLTSGGRNTLIGSYAGQSLTSGNSNTLIGFNAGGGLTTGYSNIVIGGNTSPYSNTGNNQLAIANAIYGDVGNGDTLRAKIGINVTSPTTSLEVSGTISATALRINGVAITGSGGSPTVYDGASGSLIYRDAVGNLTASSTFNISSSGSVGIGAGPPAWLGPNALYATNAVYSGNGIGVLNGPVLTVSSAIPIIRPYGTSAADLAFSSGGNMPETMRIVSNGMVGIGTSNPSVTLTISSTSGSGIRIVNSGLGVNANLTQNQLYTLGNNAPLYLNYSSNNNVLMVQGGGSVGVGISASTPSSTLQVSGTVTTSSWTLVNGGTTKWVATAPLEVMGSISATGMTINGVAVGTGSANLSETVAINDLSDASSSLVVANLYMGSYGGSTNTTGNNNTSLGHYAMQYNTTGTYNTAVGANALQKNTTAQQNTAIGAGALGNTTTGSYNAAIGNGALASNSSGASNMAIGPYAMYTNDTGNYNVAIGNSALSNQAAADSNIAIGYSALENNLTSRNTGIGFHALRYNIGGTDNVALGYYAGRGATSTMVTGTVTIGAYAGTGMTTAVSNILIGWNAGAAITTGNNNLVIGTNISPYSNTGNNQLNLGNAIYGDLGRGSTLQALVGINVTSPTVSLQVSGTVSATRFVGDGSLLTGIAGGAGTFASLTDVSYSAAGGNVFGPGSKIGAVNGVTENTAYGDQALYSASNSGSANSAFGRYALQKNTSGVNNTALGRAAMINTTTGSYNTAAGYGSLSANTTGSTNIAFGMGALESNTSGTSNAGLGYQALKTLRDGSNNAGLGSNAGWSLASGSNNTLLGDNAGGGITAGSGNIVIGSSVSPYSNTGSNQLNIGNTLYADMGLASSGFAKVGINVPSPTVALDVSGSLKVGSLVSATMQVAPGSMYTEWGMSIGRGDGGISWQDGQAVIGANGLNGGDNYMLLLGGATGIYMHGGFMGIGTFDANYTLDVAGVVAGAGAYVNTSDARLKKDVTPIAYGLETVMKLKPIGFNWIDQSEDWQKQHQLGLIAQDVEKIVPEVVSKAQDASETRSLAYGELVPVLIKAVQDLKAENDALRARVETLEQRK